MSNDRRDDDAAPSRVLPGWWWRGGEAVGYGRLLGLASMVTTALALAVLHPSEVNWRNLAAVGVFHLIALWLTFTLPWKRWSPWALLAFPLASLVAVDIAADAVPKLAGVMSGYFVLCFAFAGLHLPARGGLVLVVPALAAYAGQTLDVGPQFWVRAAFAAAAWVLLAELLNRLRRRQGVLVEQLRSDAQIDPLTGLGNRRALDRFMAEAQEGDVFIVFDLDHFKQVNDENGHAHGDLVLQTFGRLLQQQLRTRDRAARSGGEEMVVLLRCGDQDRCGKSLTSRLRLAIDRERLGVTFSAGIAVLRPGQTPLEAIDEADRATYAAKRAGRDQVWLAGDPSQGVPDVPVVRAGSLVDHGPAPALVR